MKEYVVGFLFNSTQDRVVLIKKNRPDWQKGLLNGIGGHVEPNELPIQAMVREFKEEVGVDTDILLWHSVCVLTFPEAVVTFFCASDEEVYYNCKTMTDEVVYRFYVNDILQGLHCTIDNIPSLLTLCLHRFRYVK